MTPHSLDLTRRLSVHSLLMLIATYSVFACDDDEPSPRAESQETTLSDMMSAGDEVSQDSGQENDAEAGVESDVASGEEIQGYIENEGFVLEKSHAVVLRQFSFFGPDADERLEGFTIDDVVSDSEDASTCNHPDRLDREGREGIDNQFGVIWNSVLEPLVGEAAHALLNGAINEGRMIFAVELTGVDDLENDDDVQLHFFRARGSPFVGTQGLLAPDQSYYVDSETSGTLVEGVSIKSGEIQVGPVEFQFPVDILAEFFLISIRQGQLRIRFNEDGGAEGLLGGVIDVQSFLEAGYQTNAAHEFRIVTPLVMRNTDMMRNAEGECEGISIAVKFSATTGFVIHYDDEEATAESPVE